MRSSKRAYSLAEVIVAAFVFITTVAGVLSVWTAHARGIAKARLSLVANQLGEEMMEECMAARYERVNELNDPPPNATPPIEVDFMIKDRPLVAKFYRSVTVSDLVPGEIREVKVRIEWTDSTNQVMGDRSHVEFVTELHISD